MATVTDLAILEVDIQKPLITKVDNVYKEISIGFDESKENLHLAMLDKFMSW